MFSLLLSTLAMMGLTFIIGFFVAGIIKIIANWADFLDFYRLHHNEIHNLKDEHNLQHVPSGQTDKLYHNKYRKVTHKVNDTINNLKPRKRIIA